MYGAKVLQSKARTQNENSLMLFSDTGLGKSSLFRNAPNALFWNLENRLSHICGTLSEDRIVDLKEFDSAIKALRTEKKRIRQLEVALANNDQAVLKKAKATLKDEFDTYLGVAKGEIPYVQLIVIDAMDDLYGMIATDVCEEYKITDFWCWY